MIKNISSKGCQEILLDNYIGHLAYIERNRPHIQPITYLYNKEYNEILCYSSEGHKTKSMRKNPEVVIQVEEIKTVNKWRSVVVYGNFEELYGSHAKSKLHDFSLGVKKIILKKENKHLNYLSEFSSKIESYGNPIVFRINIESIHGRQRTI